MHRAARRRARSAWRGRSVVAAPAAAVLALGLALGAGCGGGGGLGLISTEQEIQFGQEAHVQLTSGGEEGYVVCTECAGLTLASGESVTDYVVELGNQLAAIGNPDRGDPQFQIPQWTFTVLQSDEINAFALPGGFIYVTTGLLAMVRNKAELAGIVGHEVAHVTQYHGVERMEQMMVAQGLTVLIFGDDNELAQTIALFVTQFLVSPKEDELEADRHGVAYAYQAQWNPLEMNRFFEDIRALYGEPESNPLSDVLGSHPPPDERIEQVNAEAAELGISPDEPGLRIDDPQVSYAEVQAAVEPFVPVTAALYARVRIPERLRPFVHACTYDPRTRRFVHAPAGGRGL